MCPTIADAGEVILTERGCVVGGMLLLTLEVHVSFKLDVLIMEYYFATDSQKFICPGLQQSRSVPAARAYSIETETDKLRSLDVIYKLASFVDLIRAFTTFRCI